MRSLLSTLLSKTVKHTILQLRLSFQLWKTFIELSKFSVCIRAANATISVVYRGKFSIFFFFYFYMDFSKIEIVLSFKTIFLWCLFFYQCFFYRELFVNLCRKFGVS
uniref:Uncharacterized protein n=1 Tax=Cacopsylla melanoneura TaxID=428564 RepID=A0A8D8QIE1_9HEMI